MTTVLKTALATGAALSVLALAGCGEQTQPTLFADPPSSSPTPPSISHPTGAGDVVLRVDVGGGFTSAAFAFLTRPTVTITGDDQMVVAPHLDGAPFPAMLDLQQVPLEKTTVQQLLRDADAAGLLAAPPDYAAAAPLVSDMPTTTLVITADGHTWRHEAYALGAPGRESGVREVLARFLRELPADGSPEATGYEPVRLRLTATQVPGESATDVRAWPDGAARLDQLGECREVPAGDLVAVLTQATDATVFRQDGRFWSVTGAEVVPGDQGCPPAPS